MPRPGADDETAPASTTELVVPADATIVQRRNQVLDLMAQGPDAAHRQTRTRRPTTRRPSSEPVVLAPAVEPVAGAAFVWQVREELTRRLCGEDARPAQDRAGRLRRHTTLDCASSARREVGQGGDDRPEREDPEAAAEALGLTYEPWMRNLREQEPRATAP